MWKCLRGGGRVQAENLRLSVAAGVGSGEKTSR